MCYSDDMNATTSMIIQLEVSDYEQLAAHAARLGTSADTLARDFVRAGLMGKREREMVANENSGLAALNALHALRQQLPDTEPIDVVQLMQLGRDDLAQRTA